MQCTACTFVMADPPSAFCPNCGAATLPPGYGPPGYLYAPRPTATPVSGIGAAASILLAGVALAQLGTALLLLAHRDQVALQIISLLLEAAAIPVFLVWFYQVRRNAALWGPQRRSQGWSIGAWFTPVVALWFPFQIMNDVWRASAPDAKRRRRPEALVQAWWGCWILAWLAGIYTRHSTTVLADGTTGETTEFHIELGGTTESNIIAALAAVLGSVVVGKVTHMQQARIQA